MVMIVLGFLFVLELILVEAGAPIGDNARHLLGHTPFGKLSPYAAHGFAFAAGPHVSAVGQVDRCERLGKGLGARRVVALP